MRPKELRIIVTFETTTAAMAFESEAKKRQIGGRLIQFQGRSHLDAD